MSDIYIVQYGTRIVGASTKLQGAESIRTDEARRIAADLDGNVRHEDYHGAYDRLRIVNTELQDC